MINFMYILPELKKYWEVDWVTDSVSVTVGMEEDSTGLIKWLDADTFSYHSHGQNVHIKWGWTNINL